MTGPRNHARASPCGPCYFRDIAIAMSIDPNVMGREEIAQRTGVVAATPACLQCAALVENADAPTRHARCSTTSAGPTSRAKTKFRDVDPAVSVDKHLARPCHVR